MQKNLMTIIKLFYLGWVHVDAAWFGSGDSAAGGVADVSFASLRACWTGIKAAARLWGCVDGWCGGVARTYLSESANQFSCVVKGFLALGPVRLGCLDAWEPGLGAEMARLFGKGVCTGAFSFDTWESLFRSLGVEIISNVFFLLYCIIPNVKKLYTQFNFEVLSLNTSGIGGHSDSNKR